jgi:hypothetical protein
MLFTFNANKRSHPSFSGKLINEKVIEDTSSGNA